MGRRNERGFSLLEVIIAVAISVLLVSVLFYALKSALTAGQLQATRDLEQSTFSKLVDDLTSEEDDAWAIYTPPADVLGASNSDGHEIDFYARDGKQQPYFWAYTYNASSKTLTRYRFGSLGAVPTADTTYSGVTKFYVHTYPVTALKDTTTRIYSPAYASAALQSGIVYFYPSKPWIAGGNNITYVHVEGTTLKRDLQLATQTAPTGFVVVLNYTPTPSPSPTPVLTAWPVAVRFAESGYSFAQARTTLPITVAGAVNALLGGGIANAAGTCTAEAFKVGNGVWSADTSPPSWVTSNPMWAQLGETMPASNGCYDGKIWLYDSQASTFFDAVGNCPSTSIFLSGHLVVSNHTAYQQWTGGNTPANCSLPFTDDANASTAVSAETVAPQFALLSFAANPGDSEGCIDPSGNTPSGHGCKQGCPTAGVCTVGGSLGYVELYQSMDFGYTWTAIAYKSTYPVNYTYDDSTATWAPSAPPGTTGMNFTP